MENQNSWANENSEKRFIIIIRECEMNEYRVTSTQLSYCFGSFVFFYPLTRCSRVFLFDIVFISFFFRSASRSPFDDVLVSVVCFAFPIIFRSTAHKNKGPTNWHELFFCILFLPSHSLLAVANPDSVCFLYAFFCHSFHFKMFLFLSHFLHFFAFIRSLSFSSSLVFFLSVNVERFQCFAICYVYIMCMNNQHWYCCFCHE